MSLQECKYILLFDTYHVPTNSYMVNMCLSISDLLNFSRRFEELIILFIELVFDFFICSSPRLRLKISPVYMESPIKTSERFTIFNLCLDIFVVVVVLYENNNNKVCPWDLCRASHQGLHI